jgi:uroporphyrinogen decarboxylase
MEFPTLKNDLLLRVLNGESVERPPVWMMRQAGRFLPDYRKLREQYTFFERCQKPELVSEITTMPIWQVGTDAAILFSDILVVPEALGLEVQMVPGVGPLLPNTINSLEEAEALEIPDVHEALGYVMEGIKQTRMDLKGEVPLIGFAGAPFTILCYMVQGKGSKDFSQAKSFCFNNPKAAHILLQKITDITILYMEAQIKAGAQAFQLFDSWAGLLSKDAFMEFAYPYIKQIMDKCTVPNIIFAKGAWYALKEMADLNVKGVGIDWACSPSFAREQVGDNITLQGNFDPSMLHAPIPKIIDETKRMLDRFGHSRHIVNLGHGILPNVPVEHAKAFINTVKEFRY